jgi:superfamily I DNA/RNA helicase
VGGLLALWANWPQSSRLDEAIALLYPAWASWQGETLTPAQHERVAQLRLRAVPFGTDIGAFLDHMALQRGADTLDPRADRVAILSIHAAKGLEFPVVYLVGCEEGLLPYLPPEQAQANGRTEDIIVDIAEERRLFYVGMTRAQESLTLAYAARRLLFGQMVTLPPSRFINEIETARKALLTPEVLSKRRGKVADLQMKLF